MANLEQMTEEGIGGVPYGATTIAGPYGLRQPDSKEFIMAKR